VVVYPNHESMGMISVVMKVTFPQLPGTKPWTTFYKQLLYAKPQQCVDVWSSSLHIWMS